MAVMRPTPLEGGCGAARAQRRPEAGEPANDPLAAARAASRIAPGAFPLPGCRSPGRSRIGHRSRGSLVDCV